MPDTLRTLDWTNPSDIAGRGTAASYREMDVEHEEGDNSFYAHLRLDIAFTYEGVARVDQAYIIGGKRPAWDRSTLIEICGQEAVTGWESEAEAAWEVEG